MGRLPAKPRLVAARMGQGCILKEHTESVGAVLVQVPESCGNDRGGATLAADVEALLLGEFGEVIVPRFGKRRGAPTR